MEKVGNRLQQPLIDQLLHQLVTETIDIHGLARREMFDGLFALRATDQAATTARHSLTRCGLYRRITHRAVTGKFNRPRILGATALYHRNYLGNHITGTPDDNGVPDFHSKALDFIAVVQGCVGHSHAANKYRLQTRHRSNRAGTANLKFHIQQPGHFFLGREFIRGGPARCARNETQTPLQRNTIDLEHDAIDIVGQLRTLLAELAVVLDTRLNIFRHGHFTVDTKAPAVQLLENVRVTLRQFATLHNPHAVGTQFQWALCSNARVQLTQAAGGGVARVYKQLVAGGAGLFVQGFKTRLGHIDFAAHFQYLGHIIGEQFQRHRVDRAHILGNVFTYATVTAGCRPLQHPAAI